MGGGGQYSSDKSQKLTFVKKKNNNTKISGFCNHSKPL